MSVRNTGWYVRRLQKMSPAEVAWRVSDGARKLAWLWYYRRGGARCGRRPRGLIEATAPVVGRGDRRFEASLDRRLLADLASKREGVLTVAERILSGSYVILGVERKDMEDPDWFFDPVTGRRAPQSGYCFRIDHRSEKISGNVKQIWELSRMHHLTLLAMAFALSEDERYARRVAQHLRSWWRQNPFLSGIHWTSGIEVGLRLICWVWVRRLLDGWTQAPALFEQNDEALTQIWWHQRYLACFRSRGSSANNHVIAEAAGQLLAALAFNWFDQSDHWAAGAASLLEEELAKNTFPSGVNREMAFDYHGFVAELGLIAAVEADRAGRPLSEGTWNLLGRMLDVVAASVDVGLRAPRQGDGDDGRGLVLQQPCPTRWAELLSLGSAVFGPTDWWPRSEPGPAAVVIGSMARPHQRRAPGLVRPSHFADAGLTIMRSQPGEGTEIWCRCDAGPHGFLSIAAHAHADALAVEVRHGGVDILADPGTYCYQGQAEWRRYFRSTLGHNTVEIAGQDQSRSGGPTLWSSQACSRLLELVTDDDGEVIRWTAQHDGYTSLLPPVVHRRTVLLSTAERSITIIDRLDTPGSVPARVAFHLGPDVVGRMRGQVVELEWWSDRTGHERGALQLPEGPRWSLVRGGTDPVIGWYSKGFGEKEPATTVVGKVDVGRTEMKTVLLFDC